MAANNSLTPVRNSQARSMGQRTSLASLLLLLAAAGALGLWSIRSAGAEARPSAKQAADKLAPELLSMFNTTGQDAQLQYWVIMSDQADTSNTIPNARWAEKGWYVYNTLIQAADSTQKPLLAQLAALQKAGRVRSYQSFWIINSIIVTGDIGSAQALAAQPAVARVRVPMDGVILNDAPPALSTAAQAVLDTAPADAHRAAQFPATALLAPLMVQHNLNEVHAPQAWAAGYDGTGLVVGSMDTGVRWTHEALNARYRGVVAPPDPANIHDYNWFDGYSIATTPTDNVGHGSHTMGTLLGTSPNPTYGNIGVAKGAEWMTVRICGEDGTSRCDALPILNGFQWTLAPTRVNGTQPNPAYRPRISNNSWGSSTCTAQDWQMAITNWVNAGIFPDFAAGNTGPGAGTIWAPASYANAWGTGNLATSVSNWVINMQSSRGPSCFDGSIRPQAVAPGTNICSAINSSDTAYDCAYTGTSMATPHIGGAVAVLLQKNPDLTIAQVEFALTSTAFFSPTWGTAPNNNYGWGLLQLDAALDAVPVQGTPTPTVTGTPPTPTSTTTPTSTRTMTSTPTPALPSATPAGCVPQAAHWTAQAPYPLSIEWGGMAAQDGQLYSFGGSDSANGLAAAYRYDPTVNTWFSILSMPDVRFVHSVVSDGTYLYILNGADSSGQPTHIVYRYDPATNTYTTTASLPTGTGGQSAVYLNGKIYRIGGCFTANCATISNAVEAYTISSDTWASRANYPFGVVRSSAVAYGGYIYTAGAALVGANQVKTYRYDPSTDTWDDAPITDLPAPRDSAAFGVINGQFVLAGGYSNGVLTDTVIALDLNNPTGSWITSLPPLPHPEFLGNSAALAGQLYAVGGLDNSGVTNYNQRYSPGISCLTPSATPSATSTPALRPTLTCTPTVTPTMSPCGSFWRVVPSPGGGNLSGVAAVASNDVWAVGSTGGATLVEHWDGSAWSLVPSPNPGTGNNALNGVAAVSGRDVWAVGNYYSGTLALTLVEHWNGNAWSVVPSPNQGIYGSSLNGVAAVSASDVWAVGRSANGIPASGSTLIEHWNGSAWSVFPGPQTCCLLGVAAVSATDVWAVGTTSGELLVPHTLIEHWDGSAWTVVPFFPTPNNSNGLSGIAARANGEVWAVGWTWDGGIFSPDSTLVERWNGTAWSVVPSPSVGTYSNVLNAVAAVSGSAVWAVGGYSNDRAASQPLIELWNGSAWSVVPSPVVDPNNQLNGVAALPSGEGWAVGSNNLIEHYNDPCLTPTATPTGTLCPIQFTDVGASNPFYPFIRCLACRGIVGGYPCGGPGEPCPGSYYRPNNNVTRGQVSKIVSESAGFSEAIPSTQQTFEDVASGSTFALWVERLAGRGIIGGYPCGGSFEPCVSPGNRPYFRPNNNVTRGQLSKITSGAAGWTETPTGQTFEDAPPGSTFYRYIERMASRGIISGYPCGGAGELCVAPANRPYFRPNNNATRGQMSKIAASAFFPNCSTPARR